MAIKKYKPEDYNTGELNLKAMEKRYILEALKRTDNSRKEAAFLLEISERNLYNLLIKHNIKKWGRQTVKK